MRKNRESKEERKNLKNEEIRLSPLKIWDCDKKFRPSRGFPSGWLSSNYWFIHFPKAKKSRGGSGEEANRIHETLWKMFFFPTLKRSQVIRVETMGCKVKLSSSSRSSRIPSNTRFENANWQTAKELWMNTHRENLIPSFFIEFEGYDSFLCYRSIKTGTTVNLHPLSLPPINDSIVFQSFTELLPISDPINPFQINPGRIEESSLAPLSIFGQSR